MADRIYGPYTGSKENGGRRIVVVRHSDGSTTSENYARYKVEKRLHHALSRRQHVDHRDNNHENDSSGNLHVMNAHDNIAKGNKADPR
jgi:hypothetical protein